MGKKTEFYCQCHLRKILERNPNPPAEEVRGTIQTQPGDKWKYTTTWLPQKYAQVGRWLKLKDSTTGEWENHWCVMQVSEPEPADKVEGMSRDYLHQREASDI